MEDIKKLNEQLEQYNEASENEMLADFTITNIQNLFGSIQDKICNRIQYRFKDNISYFGKDAEILLEDVESLVDTSLTNLYKTIFNRIG